MNDNICNLIEIGHSKGNKHFDRNEYIDVVELNKMRKKYNNKGLFKTAYSYNTLDIENALLFGNLYLDFDSEEDFEKARKDSLIAIAFLENIFKVKEDEIMIYYSGKKGIHITVSHSVLGVEPDKKLNTIFLNIAKDIKDLTTYKTIDTGIYDSKRLFRIPNTIHQKTGLYKIPISEPELRHKAIEEIRELASKPRKLNSSQTYKLNRDANTIFLEYKKSADEEKPKNTKHKAILDYTPPCIKHLLSSPVEKGTRNNLMALLASHIRDRGFSEEKCVERIRQWSDEHCSPKLHIGEIKRTVASMYSSEKSYGCTSIKTYCDCPNEKCNFKKGR